jgi:hypothetical protein
MTSIVRASAAIHAAIVFAQPVLAGRFMSGDADALGLHGANTALVVLSGWALALAIAVETLGRRLPARLLVTVILLCIADGIQAMLGFTRVIDWHVPLGVAIFAVAGLVAAWSWRPDPAREPA